MKAVGSHVEYLSRLKYPVGFRYLSSETCTGTCQGQEAAAVCMKRTLALTLLVRKETSNLVELQPKKYPGLSFMYRTYCCEYGE